MIYKNAAVPALPNSRAQSIKRVVWVTSSATIKRLGQGLAALALLASATGLTGAHAATKVGEPAPALQLRDVQGKAVSLADYRGKLVVVEWFNPNCPFVQKHYSSQNMQGLQNRYGRQGVTWLVVNSTNPSHQDYLAPPQLAERFSELKGSAAAVLMDADGRAGRDWGAKTTPHMFIIDPQGKLVYAGGIDDKRSSNPQDVKTAKNFVAAALDEIKAGKPVSENNTSPYGCSVKY
jgi:peroxiredoxin